MIIEANWPIFLSNKFNVFYWISWLTQLLYAEIHWYFMSQTLLNRVELNQFEFLKPESRRPSLYIIMTARLPTIQSDKTEYWPGPDWSSIQPFQRWKRCVCIGIDYKNELMVYSYITLFCYDCLSCRQRNVVLVMCVLLPW